MGFVPGFSRELTRKFQSSNLHKKIQVQPFAILVPEMLVPVKTLLFFSVQKFYIYIYIYRAAKIGTGAFGRFSRHALRRTLEQNRKKLCKYLIIKGNTLFQCLFQAGTENVKLLIYIVDSCSAFLFQWNKVLFGGYLRLFLFIQRYCPDLDSGFAFVLPLMLR